MPHQPNLTRSETEPDGSVAGPAAHEDLTIAEILETMRVPAEDRPGEQCFQDGNGLRHWVSNAKAATFVGESGALHPSDHLASKGIAWELRFFSHQTQQSSISPKKPAMKRKPAAGNAAQTTANIDETLKPLEESAVAAYESLCKETKQLVSRASEKIRENPVPAVLGAAVFGAAVCYLLLSGRHESSLKDSPIFEPLADAGDNVTASLRSLYDNLKFW